MADRKRPRMSRPAAVTDLLSTVFQGTPTAQRLKEGVIWQVWQTVVGPQIAARARPAAIRNGVLTVVVASAPWLQQLNFLKSEIQNKLNDALGEQLIKDIFLKAGTLRDESTPAPLTRKPKKRLLTQDEEALIAQATAGLNDPELRTTMAGLFSRHLVSKSETE
jgi:hypothetical protein